MAHLHGLLVAAAAVLALSSARPDSNDDGACSWARERLSTQLGGHTWTNLLSPAPVSGDSLSLCPSARSCCTLAAERRLEDASWDKLRALVWDHTESLRRFLEDSAARFTERFLGLLSQAERNTQLVFSNVYAERMAAVARAPVRRLFAALEAHLVEQQGPAPEAQLGAFFDELFPFVYFHTVNPKLNDFSDDYKACLRSAQGQLRPFGDVPTRLQGPLLESLGAARTLLRATRVALEVLNASSVPDSTPTPGCGRALAQLVGCPACLAPQHSRGDSLPCSGLCLNTLRGCLAGVEDLAAPWSDLVSALHRMLTRMVGTVDLEEVLSVLDSKVSEAVMHAMENGPELSKRVKLECGDPKRRLGNASSAEVAGPRRVTVAVALRGPDSSLRAQQRQFMQRLNASRTLFSSLSETLCSGKGMEATHETPCWNGVGIGEYTKTVAGAGTAAQKSNPEVSYETSLWDSRLDVLVHKLNDMTTEILGNRISVMPESDSYTMEGSGSGAWGNGETSDDEDFDEGSGSGMGEEFTPSSTPRIMTSVPTQKAGGSGASAVGVSAACLASVLCLVLAAMSLTDSS